MAAAAQTLPAPQALQIDEGKRGHVSEKPEVVSSLVDVEVNQNMLTISGQRQREEEEVEYLHRGISGRNFERTWPLGENVEVRGATVKNGILTVSLEHIVPEEDKAKKIPITFAK